MDKLKEKMARAKTGQDSSRKDGGAYIIDTGINVNHADLERKANEDRDSAKVKRDDEERDYSTRDKTDEGPKGGMYTYDTYNLYDKDKDQQN